MHTIQKKTLASLGQQFINPSYIPENKDEFYLRDKASYLDKERFRHLSYKEVIHLQKNNNYSTDWNSIYVTDNFKPHLVRDSLFYGFIRIDDMEDCFLEFHDIPYPIGIYNSTIISCDIGKNCSISHVNKVSNYILKNSVILFKVNEMICSPYAKFGKGIIKENEDPSVRINIEICNENGQRSILPFSGMLAGDAWLWSRNRDDKELQRAFFNLVQTKEDAQRGSYGIIESESVIKNTLSIKDIKTGQNCYIKGANKLKNLTINSSFDSPTQIGEGVEMVNGIIGYGCHAFYGIKAVRFIMDDYTNLKYGARLINSYLGSNSTISCCEVLNSLIFPGHEQHHNSSFLCASAIMGQSNLASGATVGSNHNSRGNDGEIIAGRGFWPGLCVSLKHNSLFASFSLIVKGSYPSEINNPFPFSLIYNETKENTLNIIPAYWFTYNMYALARNAWKYGERDKRKNKVQGLEYSYLAPDTIGEMFLAIKYLQELALPLSSCGNIHDWLINCPLSSFLANDIEYGKRNVFIMKPARAYSEYINQIKYYIAKSILTSNLNRQEVESQFNKVKNIKTMNWENIGGQLILSDNIKQLKQKLKEELITSWTEVHHFYEEMNSCYNRDKLNHGLWIYSQLLPLINESKPDWKGLFNFAIDHEKEIAERTYLSRKKDYDNPFRLMTYSSESERDQIVGSLSDNSFIQLTNKECKKNIKQFENILLTF